ncbi:MAG: 2,3-diphosphoglycerate-dependent phosphoglycerate mutase [Candidatus Altimarinota bacterium]
MKNPGKLVLVRHGASEWNLLDIFTGWVDVPLSDQGKAEAHKAAEKLKGFVFDMAFTSMLSRASDTLGIILEDLGQSTIPTQRDIALNERHYGDLQGKNKEEMSEIFGSDLVQIWRRSFDVAPPHGESLKDTCERTIPYLKDVILPEVEKGKNVIIAAHGNSLRSIIMYLELLAPYEIILVNIATGIPYVYEFDETMHVSKKTILE